MDAALGVGMGGRGWVRVKLRTLLFFVLLIVVCYLLC